MTKYIVTGSFNFDIDIKSSSSASSSSKSSSSSSSTNPLEDFTTYTEMDYNSKVTVSEHQIDFVNLNNGENSYVYKDFGVDYFQALQHRFEFKINSGYSTNGVVGFWEVGNAVSNWINQLSNPHLIIILFNNVIRTTVRIGGVQVYDAWSGFSADTDYYCTATWMPSGGSGYGRLEAVYRTGGHDGTIQHTAQVDHTVDASSQKFRYLYGMQSYGQTGLNPVSGYIKNLQIMY